MLSFALSLEITASDTPYGAWALVVAWQHSRVADKRQELAEAEALLDALAEAESDYRECYQSGEQIIEYAKEAGRKAAQESVALAEAATQTKGTETP